MKRFSELKSARLRGRDGKIFGRGYVEQDLDIVLVLGTTSGCLAILVLAFYIEDGHSHELYRSPELIWLACLLLFYWIARAWNQAREVHINTARVKRKREKANAARVL